MDVERCIWMFALVSSIVAFRNNPNYFQLQSIESYQPCRYDGNCKENSFCHRNTDNSDGRCMCKDNFVLNRNSTFYECVKALRLNDPCEEDFPCTIFAGPLAVCGDGGRCECNRKISHSNENGQCYETRYPGERCRLDENCVVENDKRSFCVFGKCECPLKHIRSPLNPKKCIEPKQLGTECYHDEQCEIVANAYCNVKICQCRLGYVISENGTVCLKDALKFGDSCIEREQCSRYLEGAICYNNTCICQENYHPYNTECRRDKKAGEVCNDDGDCIISQELKNSVNCTAGVCLCRYGIENNKYGCKINISKAGAFVPQHIFILIFLYFLKL